MMAVNCLFLDYDGTISPLNVSRTESEVPEKTRTVLQQIGRLIPIVIITTKDLSFVVPRTPFAHAWSAVCGLEERVDEKILKTSSLERELHRVSLALKYAKTHVTDAGVEIEEKRDSMGRTIAFCVDWRRAKDAETAAHQTNRIAAYCKALSLELIMYESQPFCDVFPVSVNKGGALKEMLKELELKKGVLCIGDSAIDNPAFEASNISLGVSHEETPLKNLACDYFVKFEEVGSFLSTLLENHLLFSYSFPMIKINQGKRRRR